MADFLKGIDSEWFRSRLSASFLVILVSFLVILTRLFYLQVIQGEEFRTLSENNSIRLQIVEPQRGLIFDSRGELLVDNRPSFDVTIIPKNAVTFNSTVDRIARYTRLPGDELQARIQKNKGHPAFKPLLLRSDVDRNILAVVEVSQFDLPGVAIDVKTRRQYIHHASSAHLLGYLGEVNADELKTEKSVSLRPGDWIGKSGIEKTYDAVLRGTRGGRQVEVDASGQVMRELELVAAVSGKNLVLTIDHRLQQLAETLLGDSAGAVAALDPQNGHVLVLASSPSFDPNEFVSGISPDAWASLTTNPHRPMENKAIQAQYPPASTYKIITAIAGLEEGVIDENTTFYCPGHHRYGNRIYRCWKKGGHGTMNVETALTQSCDVYFYQVGQRLGVDRLAKWAWQFGFGSRTGIDIENEATGLIPTAAWKKQRTGIPWQGGENLSIAIGQGYNLVTPLQQASMIAAVANGGILFKPILIRSVQNTDGSPDREIPMEERGRIRMRKRTADIIHKALWNVVNTQRGTAYQSRVAGLDICGKTGTAQVVGRKTNETEKSKKHQANLFKDHAWFVAYAPAQKPRIAVAVIMEHGEHGSSAAAPIAKQLIRFYLNPEDGSDAFESARKSIRTRH